jgi:hypothetical protein
VFDDPRYVDLFEGIAAVRAHRGAFLAEIKAGNVPLAEIFERGGSDPVIASMKVLAVVEGLPEAGKVQTRRAFEELHISEAAHVSGVSAATVDALPAALVRHAL